MSDHEKYEAIARHARKKPLWTPGDSTTQVQYGLPVIHRLVHHRDPFLFVDEITAIDLKQGAIRGRRKIRENDPVFVGHFPGAPIYPGVLQLETTAQLGLCLLHFAVKGHITPEESDTPRDVRALKVHHAQFMAPIGPGAQVEILAQVVEHDDYTAICSGQLIHGDTIVCLAIMEVYLVDE